MKYVSLLLPLCLTLISCSEEYGSDAMSSVIYQRPLNLSQTKILAEQSSCTSLDEQDREILRHSSTETLSRIERTDPLTVNDIVKLHEVGISDEIIIRYIQDTKTSYQLSQKQIKQMQNSGLSKRIITFMIDTGR